MNHDPNKLPAQSKKFIMTAIGILAITICSALSTIYPQFKSTIGPIEDVIRYYVLAQGGIDALHAVTNKGGS